MSASGALLNWRSDLSWWRAFLTYVSEFSNVTTWGLGRWVKPGWDEPLPDRLVLDRETLENLRGIPFLYRWRVDALDLTSLGAGAALKLGTKFITRLGVSAKDLAIFGGAGYALDEFVGTPRKDDEIIIEGEQGSLLYWLSAQKLLAEGYTSYDVEGGHYVFYK